MAKFNTPVSADKSTRKTINLAGGEAFAQTAKLEFVSLLLTSFVQDQFYRSEKKTIETLRKLIASVADKSFLAKAAIYARTEFGMRSISHLVAGELAKTVKGEAWSQKFFERVVYRPDDITEILAYYIGAYGKPVPNALKKGLGKAFGKFDGYQLAKYRGDGKEINLMDAVNLCHPKPTEKNREALALLMKDELRSTETWESKLTQAGQAAKVEGATEDEKLELKKDAWASLITERKIGYFALLRNLRNLLEAFDGEEREATGGIVGKALSTIGLGATSRTTLDLALDMLTDEKLIKKSLVLPFRFLTALDELEKTSFEGTQKAIIALNRAVDISLSNVPQFEGKTLVVLDVSGSMQGRPSSIGALFSAILMKSNRADFITFSDTAEYRTMNLTDSTLTMAKSIRFAAGGTNFQAIFETAKKAYERVVILSDMQGWIGHHAPVKQFEEYKARTKSSPRIYSFDLAGHGSMQFPEKDVYCIAGFSDKVFEMMKLLEQDRDALIHTIEQVAL